MSMSGPLPRRSLPLLAALLLATPGLVACPDEPAPPDEEEVEEGEECEGDDDCSDGDPCTAGTCVAGWCTFARTPSTPTVLGTVVTQGPALGVNLQSARWLHVATGEGGVETFDLRPLPDEPATRARHRRTTGTAQSVSYFRSHLWVSSGATGIEVFPGDADEAVSLYRTVGDVRSVLRVDDLVVANVGVKGLEVIDYEDITGPRRYSRVETTGRAERALRSGSTIFVADGLAGVADVNFSERSDPLLRRERRIPTEGRVLAVSRRNELLILAEYGVGLGIFDLDRRGEVDRVSVLQLGGPASALRTLSRHTALVAAGDGGLVVVDLIDPERPSIVERFTFDGPALDLDRSGERVAVALGEAGVAVVDLGCTPEEDD